MSERARSAFAVFALVSGLLALALTQAGCSSRQAAPSEAASAQAAAKTAASAKAARLQQKRLAAEQRAARRRARIAAALARRAAAEHAETAAGYSTFEGAYFAIDYPTEWTVEASEVSRGSYLDTTIRSTRDPNKMLRVDVAPNAPYADPVENARQVETAVAQESGYRELGFGRTTFDGHDAIRWEFLVPEHGVLLRKVDVMFVDAAGDGVAVLTQAPAPVYRFWTGQFARIRASIVPNDYGNSSNSVDSSASSVQSDVDFCATHECIANFSNGNGYIVQCADGMWSHSGGVQGACSYHGGETSNIYSGPTTSYPTSPSGGNDLGPGNGYTVTCVDGSISHSGGIQGACSHHGGVGP